MIYHQLLLGVHPPLILLQSVPTFDPVPNLSATQLTRLYLHQQLTTLAYKTASLTIVHPTAIISGTNAVTILLIRRREDALQSLQIWKRVFLVSLEVLALNGSG